MKYFIGFIASIALVILVIILVVRGLSGGGDDAAKNAVKLADLSTTSALVRLTIDGPINADQIHNAAQITVSKDETIIETFKGYEQTVIERREYPNNDSSFASFLQALQIAGYTKGDAEGSKDWRGTCATGSRYVLELEGAAQNDQMFWTTTCKGGTFKGDMSAVRQLFIRQVPDFTTVTRRLNLK